MGKPEPFADLRAAIAASLASAQGAGRLAASTAAPRRHLAVLACMDARLDPLRLFDLVPGEAHMLRNAGGRFTPDAHRSLILSTRRLGVRRAVIVHHTDCGLQGLNEGALRAELGLDGARPLRFEGFDPFTDLEASLRQDMARLRAAPYLPPDLALLGCLYDVHREAITLVVEDLPPEGPTAAFGPAR